jgi:hypothetical protein
MYTKKARGSFSYEKKGLNIKVDATSRKNELEKERIL